ncbi:MAG: SDR family oxidoreductase [Dongiaceae bacterium]
MALRLSGKVALVTAAGQGIGRASAVAFAREGARVIATDINETCLAELGDVEGVETRRLDVLDKNEIDATAAAVGAIDILLNVAGFVHSGTILDADEEQWNLALNLNVRSMFHTIKAFLPMMISKGGGSIVNMSSVAGANKGVPNRFVYSVSKAAVIGLTKSVATDYIKQGVRCNAICPGTVQSPSLEERIRALGDYERARANFIERQPIGRLGTPEEVAELALYLSSDAAAFTTGQAHVIDGGWTM